MTPTLFGAIIIGLPLVILAWVLLWRRNRPIFWFAFVLILVAVGYLMATGAAEDIANRLIPNFAGPDPVRA